MSQQPPTELKYGQLPPEEEQEACVKEATERIQGYGFLMNRQFDEHDVEEGLKYAKLMLEEMKTNMLTPIRYNELYQLTLSHLSSLSLSFMGDERKLFSERRIAELYETLQYTPSIVPRLYLLFTVAPAFIKYGHARACDVMRDLIEMARGVQHPTRALFLRHYLLHIMKNDLPDSKNTEGGDIEDTLHFILENFKQMNVLWVRLEFSLDTKTAEERKLQRSQLKQLVGSNIQRLSMLRGLEITHYKEIVMPCIVEQITACREPLAQYYIIEIITQVFPAEFHIETLENLFEVLMKLEDDVSTLSLVTSIIKRLQTYFTAPDADKTSAITTVRLVAQQIDSLLQAGQNFSLEDTLDTLGTLLNFTLEVDTGNTSNVNSILHFVENHIDGIYGEARLDNVNVSRKLRYFLVTPLREMKDASMIFDLDFFPVLVNRMRYQDRKLVALEVCNGFSRTESLIDDTEKLRAFFNIIQVLLQKPSDFEEDPDKEPISTHLQPVARVFHLIRSERSPDETFALLTSVSTTIQKLAPEVKENLYLSLGLSILHVAVEIDALETSCETTVRNVLQHIYSLLAQDNGDPPAIPSFWIYLEATKISDRCGTEAITTEFFVSAFKLWKDSVMDSGLRYRMLISMIRTATELKNLGPSPYISITSELCSSASGLLQKDQQAEAHLLCSHMFNVTRDESQQAATEEEDDEEAFKSPDKIKNCLVRALKAASAMMDPIDQLPWFYKVLGHATYFLENGVELSIEWFNALTQKIDEQHENLAKDIESKLSRANKQFYLNLIRHKEKVIRFE
ncbi:Vacuolar protein sorting-associated protein 35 containing protein [Tritrichomonas foetus]|uniref:Vacuolar protein sorting-associated protein 35 n=1 Tax=Tritrichomonas foetus TaxID=1144522 RepID=A0A1J4KW64_9EUKA|nr:Vacuolar protein sorting-associated protein 35 containing protein [Tritrichomonas foetus]|eukprot:OHT15120.1 Vacuolar protein sorting-associated protein 35 containing protein [Tritrichomonas foetus]